MEVYIEEEEGEDGEEMEVYIEEEEGEDGEEMEVYIERRRRKERNQRMGRRWRYI